MSPLKEATIAIVGTGAMAEAMIAGLLSGGHVAAAQIIASDPRAERRQWAVAHEVGESLANRVFGQLGVSFGDIPPAARERVANLLKSFEQAELDDLREEAGDIIITCEFCNTAYRFADDGIE